MLASNFIVSLLESKCWWIWKAIKIKDEHTLDILQDDLFIFILNKMCVLNHKRISLWLSKDQAYENGKKQRLSGEKNLGSRV